MQCRAAATDGRRFSHGGLRPFLARVWTWPPTGGRHPTRLGLPNCLIRQHMITKERSLLNGKTSTMHTALEYGGIRMRPGVASWVVTVLDQHFVQHFGPFKPSVRGVNFTLKVVWLSQNYGNAGTYDPLTDQITVAWDCPGLLETIVHENLHRNSLYTLPPGRHLIRRLGFEEQQVRGGNLLVHNRAFNEGVTEQLCDEFFEDHAFLSPQYSEAYRLAGKLMSKLGWNQVTTWYFSGDFAALEAAVDRRSTPGTARRIARAIEATKYVAAEIWIDNL